jgi:hypothetical protein
MGTAEGVTLTDVIPAGTVYVPGSVTGGAPMIPALIPFLAGDLASNSPVTVTFAADLDAVTCGAEVTNSAVLEHNASKSLHLPPQLSGSMKPTLPTSRQTTVASAVKVHGLGALWVPCGTRPDFPAGAHSGANAWATNLTGDYGTSETIALTSR